MTEAISGYPLHLVSCFLVNGLEGASLAGTKRPGGNFGWHREKYPEAQIVLPLGKDGACYDDKGGDIHQAFPVEAVDTTAAGDTFYRIFYRATAVRLSARYSVAMCLRRICFSGFPYGCGAFYPPYKNEVEAFLSN